MIVAPAGSCAVNGADVAVEGQAIDEHDEKNNPEEQQDAASKKWREVLEVYHDMYYSALVI